MKIPRVVIGGTHSGVGKTSVAIGIMGALVRRGRKVQGFKMGPDFLDTSFHTAVTGRPSRNLDSWMIPKTRIPSLFASGCVGADAAVIEGVMGVFDGLNGKSEIASTSEIAKILKAPVILVVDAWGLAASAAALVVGYRSLDPKLMLRGVILNRVAGETHAKICRDAIAKHTKLPVLGSIPMNKEIELGERHLGLVPAPEMDDEKVLDKIVDHVDAHVDMEKVEKLAGSAGELPATPATRSSETVRERSTIGVARDKAFNFYYQENLDRLREAGARIEFFSPLMDKKLPEAVDGLYIGGGYPEVFASRLASNRSMLATIAEHIQNGMPVYAECGGLMYLTQSIVDLQGSEHKMVGLLDARTKIMRKLTLSYTLARIVRPNLLTREGDTLRGHEYHFSTVEDVPNDAEFAYSLGRGVGIDKGRDGWVVYNVLASYMHTSFASNQRMAEKFVDSCEHYSKR